MRYLVRASLYLLFLCFLTPSLEAALSNHPVSDSTKDGTRQVSSPITIAFYFALTGR